MIEIPTERTPGWLIPALAMATEWLDKVIDSWEVLNGLVLDENASSWEKEKERIATFSRLCVYIIYSAFSFLFLSSISWLCLSSSHTVSDSAEAEMVLILLSKYTVLKSLVHRFLGISHDKSPPAPNSRLHSSEKGLRWKMKYFHFSYLNLSCEHRSVCVWGARDTYLQSLSSYVGFCVSCFQFSFISI